MHVVHVGKYYAPYRGGIETVVEQLCRGLARRGCTVTALVSNDTGQTREDEVDGVRVIRLARAAVISSQPLNIGLPGALRRLRYDILHFHTPNPLGALSLLAASAGSPIVTTHHSDVVRQKALSSVARAAHALSYARSAAVVAPTPKHVEFSDILPRFKGKTRVIHLPIDPAPFSAAEAIWDEALPSSWSQLPLALFVGRLVYYKGLDVLLRALALAPGINLAIVGLGPLETSTRKLCDNLGLAARVAFLGPISESRLRCLYKCSRFLVLPSVAPSEAFGMVQLEAMSASRAVISTDLKSGVPYVNLHERTGLVVAPGSAPALAAALARLRDDLPLALRLGEAGAVRVDEEFHVDRVIEQHLALYTDLVAGPG